MNRRRNQQMRAALSRRQFIGRGAAFGGAVLLTPTLFAACGSDDEKDPGGSSNTSDGPAPTADPSKSTGDLLMSNWPLYIDPTEDGVTGSVDLFKEATGIDLTYNEDYNDNNEYFASIQPDLAAGKAIKPDIITPTFWLVARLIELGWIEALPFDEIPNAKNLLPSLQKPAWDPTGEYSLPWQSGMTGIAYNIEATGGELKSVNDLFDPKFKGKIGMLTEMRDTLGLVLLGMGKDPNTIAFDDAAEAFEKIEEAKSNGQIRQFTGNDYQDDLVAGNFAACIAWSGDVAQLALDEPNLRFIIPEEGGMQWSDCMVIPKGADSIKEAAAWMDYVYDPVNAARIVAWVGYNSPVAGVQDELRKNPDTASLADSTLMFPDDETLGRLKVFKSLDEDEEAQFDERFSQITTG